MQYILISLYFKKLGEKKGKIVADCCRWWPLFKPKFIHIRLKTKHEMILDFFEYNLKKKAEKEKNLYL